MMVSSLPLLLVLVTNAVGGELVPTTTSEPKSIAVRMVATWTQTPLLVEAAEFIAGKGDSGRFWWFLEALLAKQSQKTPISELEEMSLLEDLTKDTTYGGPCSADVMRYTAATGFYSPKVEMWRQVWTNHLAQFNSSAPPGCQGVVFLSGRFHCGTSSISLSKLVVEDGEPEVFGFDRIYPGGPNPPADPVPTVILYGDLRWSGLQSLHEQLRKAALDQNLRYIFRPLVPENQVLQGVQGWGVQLDIKDVEYKVIDDTKVDLSGMEDLAEEGEEEDAEEENDGEVRGFDFSTLKKRRPDLASQLTALKNELLAEQEDEEVKMWDLGSLGYQAAHRIIQAGKQENGLEMLAEIAQNFPSHLSALAKLKPPPTLKPALQTRFNSRTELSEGDNVLLLNGQVLSLSGQDAGLYSLQGLLEQEASAADGLSNMGLSPAKVANLLASPLPPLGVSKDVNQMTGASEGFKYKLGLHLKGEDKAPVFWLNNLEKNTKYKGHGWHQELRGLLSQGWPNQLRYVAKNMYHMILVLDPTSQKGLWTLRKLKYFVETPRNAPVRIGVILSVPQDSSPAAAWRDAESDHVLRKDYRELYAATAVQTTEQEMSLQEMVARLARLVLNESKSDKVWEFLSSLWDGKKPVTLELAKAKCAKLLGKETKSGEQPEAAMDKALSPDPDSAISKFIAQSRRYLSIRGLDTPGLPTAPNSRVVGLLINGKLETISSFKQEAFQQFLLTELLMLQRQYMTSVYFGLLSEETDLMEFPDTQQEAKLRVSPHILQDWEDLSLVAQLPPSNTLALLPYAAVSQHDNQHAEITLWVVANLASPDGQQLVRAALQYLLQANNSTEPASSSPLNQSKHVRVCVLPSKLKQEATQPKTDWAAQVFPAVQYVLFTTDKSRAKVQLFNTVATLTRLAYLKGEDDSEENGEMRERLLIAAVGQAAQAAQQPWGQTGWAQQLTTSPGFAQAQAVVQETRAALLPQVPEGHQAIIVNGRVLSFPPGISAEGIRADLALLIDNDLVLPVGQLLGQNTDAETKLQVAVHLSKRAVANHLAAASSAASSYISHNPQQLSELFQQALLPEHPVGVVQSAKGNGSWLSIQAVINPLSEQAPLLSELLLGLHKGLGAEVVVLLNPSSKISKVPLAKFYRYVYDPTLSFDSSGRRQTQVPGALFNNLRTSKLLSLQLSVPSSWLVQSSVTPADVDNIRLPDLETNSLSVQYSLTHLLVSGSCYEPDGYTAPAGLQLYLSSPSKPQAGDTVVMENMGYFQLKANPGVWSISLDPLHASVYRIIAPADDDADQMQVAVSSYFQDSTKLKVHRRTGQEETRLEDLSPEGKADSSLWGSFWKKDKAVAGGKNETVHIFSIASGFLYERFLKIMMQSVVRNTKSPVKFWFIQNFLSPQFKAQAQHLAKHDSFEVEFVTYRWPTWLRAQSVKQRVIWGYKILFLDVLFPLAVRRIIYIDADQVVRGDVAELWRMKLTGGAPYAYVPFCDSNKEVEGYRFWKQGYWKQHLRDLPYHISALYVVDMVKFRQMRAGDRLRIMYQALTEDPNSLANLDQDLPNHAQHQVPIHSLPQDWLWCQTWCAMDTLPAAKTIDLCNNPMTKTPKLEVAKSLLPEWTELDDRARKLAEEYESSVLSNVSSPAGRSPPPQADSTQHHTHPEL
eukprot:gb/GEZN01000298.1/.p1 GENE.gb/GEZN01000298.1/~~gb/GEZN01000298.1/.p1  ORF type:complete len:1655 (+),score=392.74 gb/GEZN01000298.1/:38-5002(+)